MTNQIGFYIFFNLVKYYLCTYMVSADILLIFVAKTREARRKMSQLVVIIKDLLFIHLMIDLSQSRRIDKIEQRPKVIYWLILIFQNQLTYLQISKNF